MPEEPSTDSAKRLTPSRGGKPSLAVVTLLDGNTLDIYIERKAKGEKLFEDVCKHLELIEKDYFALSFRDKAGRRAWLDLDKRIGKILKGDPWKLDFEVKFYPKDPGQLHEDFTRYLLCLQVRNDILCGKLPCSFVTYAVLGAYLVQSQLGDYSVEDYPDSSYLSGFKFCPEQASPPLIEKVMALHKDLKGQRPAEAEYQYLESAKKLSLYGVDMHPAKDSEGVELQLGVCSTGILVYQDLLRINRFAWPKILKISYRRNNFYIKIRPGEFEQYEQTVGFKLDSSRSAKNLWKVCVDQHTFFRLMTADAIKRPGFIFPRIGSLYRWNRKTQAEVLDSTLDTKNTQNFQRSHSYGPSRSFDTLTQQQQEPVPADDSVKRHTMSHAPARPIQGSPAKLEKKPAGGVAVLPPIEPHRKKKMDKDKENATNGLTSNEFEDDEKENRLSRIDDSTMTPVKEGTSEKKKQSPAHGLITTIFANTKEKKSPKDKEKETLEKKEKDKKKKEKSKKEKIALAETVSGEVVADDGKQKDGKKGDSGFGSLVKLTKGKDSKEDDKDKVKTNKKEKDTSKNKSKDSKENEENTDEKSKKSDKLSVFKTDKKDKKKKDDKTSKKDKKLDSSKSSESSKSPDTSLDTTRATENDRSLSEAESTNPYTKVYEYTVEDEANRPKSISGFSYEAGKLPKENDDKSPNSPVKKGTGVAYNYAPELSSTKAVGSDDGTGSKKIFSLFSKKHGSPKTDKQGQAGDTASSKSAKSKKEKDDKINKKVATTDFLEAERQLSGELDKPQDDELKPGPKIVKTTTKSSIVNTGGTLTQNVEEKVEDISTGEVTHSTHVNTAEGLKDSNSPFTATAVTTRTATTLEDLGTNAKTSQVEEKTVARSTKMTGSRQEQRVVTQEVRATTVVNEPQVRRSESTSSVSSDDSGTPIDCEGGTYYTDKPQGPIVETETVVYSPVVEEGEEDGHNKQTPLVSTMSQRMDNDGTFELPGAVVTSQIITSKSRTVETVTYKTEKDGVVETRVEQKITIQSDGDPIDHDKALAEAIQEATAMNPDMRVEKIEIQQEALP